MAHETEIKQLRANIKAMRKALTLIDLLTPLAMDSEEQLANSLHDSPIRAGLFETAKELTSTFDRTGYEYLHAIEYFERRIRILQNLDRDERYKVKARLTKKVATPKAKDKPLQVTFSPTHYKDSYRVIVGDEPIGIIRKAKAKYVSGTAKVFTKEALATRQFVKDGLLQVEDKELFSTTKFKTWEIYRQPSQRFNSFGDAAVELIAQKLPEGVKVTL